MFGFDRTTRDMMRRRILTLTGLGAVALGVFATACGEASTTAPTLAAPVAAAHTVFASPITVKTLQRTKPLTSTITASITLYNTGGMLDLPQAGLHITIPKTALPYTDRPFTMTVTAIKGSQIAYEFGPSGTKFKAALNVTQDLTNTTWAGNTGNATLTAEYFKSTADLNPLAGTALSYEELPADVMASGLRLHWDIWHFSGYMVATGRQ